MSRARALIAALAAVPLVAALAKPALAGGPIYAYLRDLPPPIAKLHTCIGPKDRTLRDPNTWRVGKQFVFQIGCPENAPNITVMPGRDDSGRVQSRTTIRTVFRATSITSLTMRAGAMRGGWCCRCRAPTGRR